MFSIITEQKHNILKEVWFHFQVKISLMFVLYYFILYYTVLCLNLYCGVLYIFGVSSLRN
jgi:hypothetical protein